MIKLLIIILFPVLVSAQEGVEESTFTNTTVITDVTIAQPTTGQILMNNKVSGSVTNNNKLAIIGRLLNDAVYYKSLTGVDIDAKTGQDLTNLKTNIEKEILNTEQGRNYSAGITYPVYKVNK